ncbi:MAG: hypothetical protein WC657_01555 [Candidatus Paceibacterota bacterium]|jgi:hypothetical protein
MTILIICALVGFIFGIFFSPRILAVITVLSAVASIAMLVTAQGAEGMVAMVFVVCVLVGNGAIWVTYLARKHLKIV